MLHLLTVSHAAALEAHLEPSGADWLAANFESVLTRWAGLSDVQLAQRQPLQQLPAERHALEEFGAVPVLASDVNQIERVVERLLAVIRVVDGRRLQPRRQRPRAPEVHHLANLSRVGPVEVAATRALRRQRRPIQLSRGMAAPWAQAPDFDQRPGRGPDIDLVDAHFATVGVEGVERCQLANGTAGWPDVFLCLVVSGAIFDTHADDRFQPDPRLGKRVIGEHALVGQHVQRILAALLENEAGNQLSRVFEIDLLLVGPVHNFGIVLDLSNAVARLALNASEVGNLDRHLLECSVDRRPHGVARRELAQALGGCFRHQLLLPRPYLVLTKPLRLDIQCQRAASVKIGWKYLDD